MVCDASSTWKPPATWVARERSLYVWSGLSLLESEVDAYLVELHELGPTLDLGAARLG